MPPAEQTLTLRCQFCDTWNRVDAARATQRPKCGKCARFLLLDRPWMLHDASFARTIAESDVPILVDFYADWCAPCKVMAPSVDALAAKYSGSALVAKLNTDHAPATAQQYDIRGIPTVVVFHKGKVIARQSGAVPFGTLEQLLQQGLAAA